MSTAEQFTRAEVAVFKPELHAFAYRAIFEVGDQVVGAKVIDDLLSDYGLTRDQFLDPEAWVSLEFTESFLDRLYKLARDPQIFTRVARLAMSPKYLGPRGAFIRAFASPMAAYLLVARTAGTMNKTGTYVVERTGRSSCVLTFTPVASIARERTPHMCNLRLIMHSSVTPIFDLPAATIVHPTCIARGDDTCTYEVSWTAPASRLSGWLGGILGMLAGAAVFQSHVVGLWPLAAVVAATGIGGWLIGRTARLQRELSSRTHDLTEQQDALETSLRTNEERFSELLEAKADVDRKVEQRTAELQDATARLSRTLNEIQALDRAKTDFFNNVSHELRSPLTLILAPLDDMVAGREPPGGTQSALEVMHRNTARLLQVINQLLDLAKIDAGEMKIALLPTDLLALARSAVAGFEAAATAKGVLLTLEGPAGLPALAVDASWIESAITNLLANALRLTPAGGSVRLSIEDHGGDVCISVIDEGPGIDVKDHEKIFQRFAQADSSKVIGGTGIGLALVREAVRLHGGNVAVSSELGKGATFTLKLPRRSTISQTQPPTIGEPSQARPRPGMLADQPIRLSTKERAAPTPNAPVALVVEDDADLREFMMDVLAVRYRVYAAENGALGLQTALEVKPDVVISDLAMPEMNGYELCKALRAHQQTQSIPFLLVTARTDTASVLDGFEAGANDYVIKPFHGRELLARVDVHVRLRRMVQQLALRDRQASLGVLAASVAHHVRNPLTTLVSGLPAMQARLKGKVDTSTAGLIEMMIDCAHRIERLTYDLMDLSRVDREAQGVFRPSDGLQAAVRLVRARVTADVSIEESITEAPVTLGRASDINQVFLNLLDNAVRAVTDSGVIRVSASSSSSSWYTIRVEDSGKGIDDEVARRIFEPFFTTRPAGEGTGLGLAIAHQVMQQAGGTITAGTSDLGGAAFTVQIPITSVANPSPMVEPAAAIATNAR